VTAEIRDPLSAVRGACVALPEVTERLSHGAPTFFVRGRSFATAWIDGHHQHAFAHAWCASDPVIRAVLIDERPDVFFVPPYVGHRGWVAVRLDRDLTDEELADLLTEAYRLVAPAALSAGLDVPGADPATRPGGRPERRRR
jgi:hypothetical protein